ncbi:MAG: DUF192 domain-containing protein [Treponema sp.]
MNYRKKFICFFAFTAFAVFILIETASCTGRIQRTELEIAAAGTSLVRISAELALTKEEQQQGFMHRTEIPDSTGMLFVYDKDARLYFWMKDTPSPLSIAFIDSKGIIREIYDMQPFSLETISSTHSVRYALEVPQGFFQRTGITIGDFFTAETMQRIKNSKTL